MRAVICCVVVFLLCMTGGAAFGEEAGSPKLKTYKEKLGYTMGRVIGESLKSDVADEVDFAVLLRGVEEGFNGKPSLLTPEEVKEVQQKFTKKMEEIKQKEMAKQVALMQEMQVKNKDTGDAYLDENKKKKGVTETKSGLQYEVLQKGEGDKPQGSDVVTVDYVGTLIDGTEFDSSVKRGKPIDFPLDRVIPGWTEAVSLMSPGAKYRIVIPSELAYGERGSMPVIQPNSVLIFEVTLHSFKKAEPVPESEAAGK